MARSIGERLVVFEIGRLDGRPPEDSSRGWLLFPKEFSENLPDGVLLVDATEAVVRHYSRAGAAPLTLSKDNDHPNSLAHEIFAQLLMDRLLASGLLARVRETNG